MYSKETTRETLPETSTLFFSVDDRVMGQASGSIKLPPGSVMEIFRLPGYIIQTKGTSKVGKLYLLVPYIHYLEK